MNQLEESRQEINEVDAEIVKLFERRFHAVKQVAEYKMANRLPVLDSEREKSILEKNTSELSDHDLDPYFKKWYQDLLDISRDYQKDLLKK